MKGPFAAVLLSLSLLGGCVTVPQGTDFPAPTKPPALPGKASPSPVSR